MQVVNGVWIVFRIDRNCSREYQVTEGLWIPKDSVVSVPVHTIHHSEEYYPQPEEFRPERFAELSSSSNLFNRIFDAVNSGAKPLKIWPSLWGLYNTCTCLHTSTQISVCGRLGGGSVGDPNPGREAVQIGTPTPVTLLLYTITLFQMKTFSLLAEALSSARLII